MPTLERSARPLRTSNVEHVSSFTDLAAQVRESNINRRARWFYLGLGTLLVAGLVGAAIGTYLLGDSWLVLIMAGALGVLFTQAAFVAHEASHRQILSSGPANDRLGRVIGVLFVGMSYQWWMNKHTRHHANPNKIGKDPDIDLDGVAFTTESAAAQTGLRAFLTRYQGAAFYPLMLLEGVNLHWLSIRSLAERRKVNGRAIEITLLVVRFAVYFGLLFLTLPLGHAFAFIGVQLAVFGLYMGTSFAVNHIGMAVIQPGEKLDFLARQVRTSRNIRGGFWASLLLGGLNYQIEHHLFPNMARPRLHAARALVRAHCAALGITYTEVHLGQAHAAVAREIRRVGLAARSPYRCPVVAGYRAF